jgi:acetylornithine deacetylase/succinyl-diaminopimelate desuccinylase-like protein
LENRSWRAALSITGVNGIPAIESAGNVTLPHTSYRISMRIPPNADTEKVAAELKRTLEKSPPFNASVSFDVQDKGQGWNSPKMADWLESTANKASKKVFGKEMAYIGEGGTIPFMGQLGEQYPKAQFLILGILGPKANAHGPNEFLHIPMVKKLSCALAYIVSEHAQH